MGILWFKKREEKHLEDYFKSCFFNNGIVLEKLAQIQESISIPYTAIQHRIETLIQLIDALTEITEADLAANQGFRARQALKDLVGKKVSISEDGNTKVIMAVATGVVESYAIDKDGRLVEVVKPFVRDSAGITHHITDNTNIEIKEE